jgi:hypothetical protein
VTAGRSRKSRGSGGCRGRRCMRGWRGMEADGVEGLADRSHRPRSCPHQLPAVVEALALELRRSRPYWGARRRCWGLRDLAGRKGDGRYWWQLLVTGTSGDMTTIDASVSR